MHLKSIHHMRELRSAHNSLACCLLAFASITLAQAASTTPQVTPAALGKAFFFDPSLSVSGKMSCATCHDPAHAHAQNNVLSVQFGGAFLDVPGFRAVPSLRYLNLGIAFHFARDGTPIGGFNRDGRANSLLEQAERPLLASHEMANGTPAETVARLANAGYADEFRRVFGNSVFDDIDGAFFRMQFALEKYEATDPGFHPFDSKYDYFLAGKVGLSAQELRGFSLFNRPDKGKCLGCHPSTRGSDGSPPVFTDYTYDNLGLPRNTAIAANADPSYYDLGLCGPFRIDLAEHTDLCGAFKVPTLRNVATRQVFFHNGSFMTLTDAIRFYVRRDTNPEQFYALDANGVAQKFNDLPAEFHKNVNTSEVPYDRHPGETPRLNEDEIADLVAFLQTLTDGYDALSNSADPARSLNK
jgi:cytochrome c peroxidase